MSNTKQITEFTFWDFCQSVEVAINEGYTFLNTNEGFPQATTGLYTCIMVQKEVPAVVETSASINETSSELSKEPEVTAPASRGRKPKN